jgi:glutamate transport system permease protein
MTAVLYDVAGPRTRRRVLIGSVVSGVVIALLVAVAVARFADKGQFEGKHWVWMQDGGTWRYIAIGLWMTVRAALAGMVLAMAVGAFLALARLSKALPLRWLATTYIEIFRALPVLLLILFGYLALPKLGVDISPFQSLVLGLTLYNSAVLAEIFRAGILSLDRGQSEAAYSVGLTYGATMRYVVVPQAFRRMIPSLISQLVTLLKDTSYGYIVTYEELLRRAKSNSDYDSDYLFSSYITVLLIYVAVNFSLSRVAQRLEVRQRRRYGAGTIEAGTEDLALLAAEGEAKLETAGAISKA